MSNEHTKMSLYSRGYAACGWDRESSKRKAICVQFERMDATGNFPDAQELSYAMTADDSQRASIYKLMESFALVGLVRQHRLVDDRCRYEIVPENETPGLRAYVVNKARQSVRRPTTAEIMAIPPVPVPLGGEVTVYFTFADDNAEAAALTPSVAEPVAEPVAESKGKGKK